MSTLTAPAARVKPTRTVRLLSPGLIRITETVGRKTTRDLYTVKAIHADYGKAAYEMSKIKCADMLGLETEEPYHVSLDAEHSSCECKGHLRHGHKTLCRHIAALVTLRAQGKL